MKIRPVVLAVGPMPPPISGMTKAFQLVAEGLPSLGWDVRIVDIADPVIGRANGSFSMVRARSVAMALLSIAKKLPSADVVYLTISQSRLGFAKDTLFLGTTSLFRRPAVVHMHGGNFGNFFAGLSRPEQFLVRATLDRLSSVIVLTNSLKADFNMTRDWEQRTVAISNASEAAIGLPRTLPPGRLRILYLSNLVISKGYRDLVMAAGILANRRPELSVRLDLAGALAQERDFPDERAQRTDLDELLATLPPAVTARYHGLVRGEAKAELLAEADVFVLPTWYVNEGQPIAILEALSAGLPVVATDWRGIRESLPASMQDLLVAPRNPQAIADQLERLVDDPQGFAARSRDAVAHAQNFRPERHLAAIDGVLRTAMNAT